MKATAERYTFVQGGSRGADPFSLPLNPHSSEIFKCDARENLRLEVEYRIFFSGREGAGG
jgi:hypothetical protein